MGVDYRRPALLAGITALTLALGIVCHSASQFLLKDGQQFGGQGEASVLLQQARQRGAMAGARGGRVVEPKVGQILKRVEDDSVHQHRVSEGGQPLVTMKTVRAALSMLKGTGLPQSKSSGGKLQQLQYTGRYADTSYVVNAPEGDPATVVAHNSIWPAIVHRDQPYVEQVHGDGTPFMQPLTVYAPPGGTVVSSIVPGTAARPPTVTRYALLPEADNSPLDNTVYKCAPSGYMVGPIGYHCSPACKDSALWRSDYGDCQTYSAGVQENIFKDYCGSDKDIAGVPAAVACPVACGTCGIGLCYEGSMFKKCKLSTYSTVEESA